VRARRRVDRAGVTDGVARRLVERGVRFVQLYHTNWDSHGGPGENLQDNFDKVCRDVDQGCAALIRDLKQRGLLDDTLVIWGGEFGRTPMGENRESTGRNHHIECASVWMTGGGVKAGAVIGKTDELGFAALVADLKKRCLLYSTLVIWGGEFGRTPMNEERDGSKWLGRDHHQHAFTLWMAGGGIKAGTTYGKTDELGYHVTEDGVHVHDLQATILQLMGLDHEKLTYRFQGRDYRLTDVFGKVVKGIMA